MVWLHFGRLYQAAYPSRRAGICGRNVQSQLSAGQVREGGGGVSQWWKRVFHPACAGPCRGLSPSRDRGTALCVRPWALYEPSAVAFWRDESRRELLFLVRSEEHTSELQSRQYLVCRLLL